MGIQGLLPVLKPITNTIHVSKYRGQKVAVDAYCWLHKAAYCCAEEICEGRYTDKHVLYCMQKVKMLQQCGVQPIIVFDGGRLPMKATEEGTRSRARKENREKAAAHIKAGNKRAAEECYQRAVDISPATANEFIKALKAADVDFIVAPFEADAQMAYLAVNDIVHSVITEDSDLLPYGCPRVLFKMDKAGEGQEIIAADLAQNRDPSFIGFTHQMFLEMCIFAGCDFLKALPGIGMKKAHQHVKRLKSHRKVCKSLRFSGTSVPRDYEQSFQRALWTFQHQRVWCPQRKQLVHLRPLPQDGLAAVDAVVGSLPEDDVGHDFLGPVQPDAIMRQVAEGDLDPITLKPFPPPALPSSPQVRPLESSNSQNQAKPWNPQRRSSEGKQSGGKRQLTLPVQANGITSYFPSLPSNGGAFKQFSAPRATSKLKPTAPLRHSLLGKRSNADACGTDEEQPSTSGRFSTSTSPAGKASRHLSGCGSQPELPHPFSSFAAGKTAGRTSAQSDRPLHRSSPFDAGHSGLHVPHRQYHHSPTPDQTDSPAVAASIAEGQTAQPKRNSLPLVRVARSLTPEQMDSPAAASTTSSSGLLGPLQSAFSSFTAGRADSGALQGRADIGAQQGRAPSSAIQGQANSSQLSCGMPVAVAVSPQQDARRPAYSKPSTADGPHVLPDLSCTKLVSSDLQDDSNLAATRLSASGCLSGGDEDSEPSDSISSPVRDSSLPTVVQDSPFRAASQSPFAKLSNGPKPGRRKVSAHFGSSAKRHQSAGSNELHTVATPYGVLGGLVNRLQPKDSSPEESTNDTDIDVEAGEAGSSDTEQDPIRDAAPECSSADDIHTADGPQQCLVAGLEHIQPFASIASKVVNDVTAASLQKFGLGRQEAKGAVRRGNQSRVRQPFAPPRSCNASQSSQSANFVAPSLQQFVCKAGNHERV